VYSQRQRAAVIAIGCRCTAKRATFQSGKHRIAVPIPMVESDCCDHGSKSYRARENRDLGGTLARKSTRFSGNFVENKETESAQWASLQHIYQTNTCQQFFLWNKCTNAIGRSFERNALSAGRVVTPAPSPGSPLNHVEGPRPGLRKDLFRTLGWRHRAYICVYRIESSCLLPHFPLLAGWNGTAYCTLRRRLWQQAYASRS
jgi:hypothetical protein